MASFSLSKLAQSDIRRILQTSNARWGEVASQRYAATIAAALRQIASDPQGPTTRAREELAPHIRSFHLRNTEIGDSRQKVRRPVHIVLYRTASLDSVEIVRVLHENMELTRHLGEEPEQGVE